MTFPVAQLKEQTPDLGLTDDVAFVGHVPHEDMPKLMQDFEIFVMPSIHQSETFEVAAIQASACELPVITTSVGGVSEAVVDGKTGLLVPAKDPKALAHACIHLIEQPDRRLTLGKAGRRFVLDRFRMEKAGAKMNALYHSVLRQ